MSKAFIKETEDEPEPIVEAPALPAGVKNYMTPEGHRHMQEELRRLMREERPKVVEVVAWAAGNGDRSENGDYIYGKKRLREIDSRIRFLTKRLESAEIVDPHRHLRERSSNTPSPKRGRSSAARAPHPAQRWATGGIGRKSRASASTA